MRQPLYSASPKKNMRKAGVLYAAFHNNDLNFGGTATVISPSK